MQPRSLSLAQGRLAALSWGRPEAPLWLGLHGWLDNAATFSRLAPMLTTALDIRLVALDLPGHGHSRARGEGADYPVWGYLEDVAEVLDALEAETATLIGHSMGAGIASLFAAVMPARVANLVLLDGLAPTTTESESTLAQMREAFHARQRPRRSIEASYLNIQAAVDVRVRGGATRLDADTAWPLVERNLLRGEDGRYRWRTDRRLALPSWLRWSPQQMLDSVSAIMAPALLIQATAGVLNARPHIREARKRYPQLERRVLSGGHHLHLERIRVASVAEAITRWSRTSDTASASR